MKTCEWCRRKYQPDDPRQIYCSKKCRDVVSVTNWRARTKKKLVKLLGGKCKKCGYDKCIAALSFHHKEGSKKEFGLSLSVIRGWKRLVKEVKKCILLCANCHMEKHYLKDHSPLAQR